MSSLSQFGSGGLKSIQRLANNASWKNGTNATTGSARYIDVPILTVDPNKTIIVPNRESFVGGDNNIWPIKYFLHPAGNLVRCLSFVNGAEPGFYVFEVLEFR